MPGVVVSLNGFFLRISVFYKIIYCDFSESVIVHYCI
jgi:hypothetical protein